MTLKHIIKSRPLLYRTLIALKIQFDYLKNTLVYRHLDPKRYFVFTNKKLVYLVNPKVAQTTIINTCGEENPQEYKGVTDRNKGYKTHNHRAVSDDDFVFTFIRNPFERIYSCWYSKYHADKEIYNKTFLGYNYYLFGLLKPPLSFEDFVRKIANIPDRVADRHFKSQYYLIEQENPHRLDYIGRIENFEEDFEPIRQKFNLEKPLHMNRSQKKANEWMQAYTPELVEIVYDRYRDTLEKWYPNARTDLLDYINQNS